jgi:hypothetical protein
LDRAGTAAAVLLGGIAAVWSLLLIFDGRYRDFPNHHMIVPLLAFLALGWLRRTKPDNGLPPSAAWSVGSLFRPALPVADAPVSVRLETVIGWVLLLGAPLTVVAEGFAPVESLLGGQLPLLEALHEVDWLHPNIEALAWAAMQLGLAIPFRAAAKSGR